MSKQTILLVDDHAMVRTGLKMLINAQPDMEVIGEAGNGKIAITQTKELMPDIVVMDLSMPELDGLKATRELKKIKPKIKVLALTCHTEDAYLKQFLQAGVVGYVLKQSAPSELIMAIRSVSIGNSYLDPAITSKVINKFVAHNGVEPNNKATLSDRESEILRLIAWGYSNKEIAAKLQLSVKTIEAHKANTMKKLNLESRIDIVRYALLKGWLQDS